MAGRLHVMHRLSWVHDVDWGNVPAWVGGTLTGASFLLGFSILRRTQKRDERAQAQRVSIFPNFKDSTEGITHRKLSTITIRLRNHSDQPIYYATIYIRYAKGKWDSFWLEEKLSTLTSIGSGQCSLAYKHREPSSQSS